jgi:hypothetical protein
MRLIVALLAVAILARSQQSVPSLGNAGVNKQEKSNGQNKQVSDQNKQLQSPVVINQYYDSQVRNRPEGDTNTKEKHSISLDEISTALLALFTLILAGATILLACVAYLQWKTMKGHERALSAMATHIESGLNETAKAANAAAETARVAHENFTHAYRPRLAIRFMTIHGVEPFGDSWGEFLAVNVGDTKAVLKGYQCDIVPLDANLPTIPPYAGKDEKPLTGIELLPSESTYMSFPDYGQKPKPNDFSEHKLMRQGELYVLGWIRYADATGREHRKGFAFLYIRDSRCFEPVRQEDYHYDD